MYNCYRLLESVCYKLLTCVGKCRKLLNDINDRLITNTITDTWKKELFLPVDCTVYNSVYGVHNYLVQSSCCARIEQFHTKSRYWAFACSRI